MADEKNPTPFDYLAELYEHAPGNVFICALPNNRGDHREFHVATRDRQSIDSFVAKRDRPGSAIYYCAGTLKPGAEPRTPGGSPRCKENIAWIIGLYSDTDLKSVTTDRPGIISSLTGMMMPPSKLIWSGRGAQALWLFNEPLEATPENVARVEQLNSILSDVVGGDPVQDVCRLLRLPGSHNTKDGGWLPCEVIPTGPTRRYEIDDLDEYLGWVSPVIRRKEAAPRAAAPVADNPYLRIAAEQGFKVPIDVEQRLAQMSYQGTGEASIHNTQLAVSASLLNQGENIEDVVSVLLDATQAAAGPDGSRWRWDREERALRRMCEDWRRKHPDAAAKPKAAAQAVERGEAVHEQAERREATGGGGGAVVQLAEERKKREKPEKPEKPKKRKAGESAPVHVVIGSAVIEAMRSRGESIMFTTKGAYLYRDGLWSRQDDGLRGWLDVEIEIACRALNLDGTIKARAEARGYIQANPDLWRFEAEFDQHGKIPTRSGLVDLATGEVEAPRPEHLCSWRIEADYDPAATCPLWLQMVSDTFADRGPEGAAEIVGTLQEILGAALIDIKPRALSKALCLVGGSNCGKSGVLEVLSGLFGGSAITAGLESLEGAHGLMPFMRRVPWVLHEAFDQRKWHFSSTVKAIITAEPVAINIKNGPMISQRIRSPIFWGTNHPPQFREATRAIVNRLIVIECRREFPEGEYIGVAREARRRGLDRPSTLVTQVERSGLLNWAIAGLRRALERGAIHVSAEIREAADEIHRDSNLAAGFIEECVEFDPDRRVAVPDFCAAFAVWWLENKGEDRSIPSNDAIGRAVHALADRRIASHPKETKDKTRRYLCGIILNDQGEAFWKRAGEASVFEGKLASTTSQGSQVNGYIPESWIGRPSVFRMRVAQVGVTHAHNEVSPAKREVSPEGEVSPGEVSPEKVSPEVSPGLVSPTQVPDASKKPLF